MREPDAGASAAKPWRGTVKAPPEVTDVYWLHPRTAKQSKRGDHDWRPAFVTEVRARVALNVVRTTREPSKNLNSVPSPVNAECELDKAGWWTEADQRPVPVASYKTAECGYSGRLPTDEAEAVTRMWNVLKMLGRAN